MSRGMRIAFPNLSDILGISATPSAAPSVPANEVVFVINTSGDTWAGVEIWEDDYEDRVSILDTVYTTTHSFAGDLASLLAGRTYNWQAVAWHTASPDEFGGTPISPESELGTPFLVDEVAPTLTDATAGTITTTTVVPTVTTDESNGTLYYAVVTSGGSCTDAQLKAGGGGDIIAGKVGNQAVTATGVQTFDAVTGLTAETDYDIKFLHRNSNARDSAQASVSFETQTTLALNLTYYWKFDEASATDDADEELANIYLVHATSMPSVAGALNGGRQLVRADSDYFVRAQAVAGLLNIADNATSYTFGFWAKPANLTNGMVWLSKRLGDAFAGDLEYLIYMYPTTGIVQFAWGKASAPTYGYIDSTVGLNTGSFLPVVFGYDASESKFFVSVDGETKVKSAVTTDQTVNGSNAFIIGRNSEATGTADHVDGVIDEMAFWSDRAISQAEITAFKNAGTPLALEDY